MGRKFEVRKAAMAKTNLQKTKLYSRYGKEIYMAAKQGGPSPEANMTLKRIIDKAKSEQVPSDIIKRNIDKASSAQGEDYQAIRYEGFGPGGSTLIVDAMTDNVNRTIAEVRNCFTKCQGKLGVTGSVEHGYEHLSHVVVHGMAPDQLLEYLLEKEIEIIDIEPESEGTLITAKGYDLEAVVEVLSDDSSLSLTLQESGWFALDEILLDASAQSMFEKLLSMLDSVEDVSNVYHNVKEDPA
jgi:YebC/PmpR family DNA-binding regulatory protein